MLILTRQQQTAFENIVEKGEIARNEQFLLFPQCFVLNQIILSPYVHIFDIISLFAAEWVDPKISIPSKGSTPSCHGIHLKLNCSCCHSCHEVLTIFRMSARAFHASKPGTPYIARD